MILAASVVAYMVMSMRGCGNKARFTGRAPLVAAKAGLPPGDPAGPTTLVQDPAGKTRPNTSAGDARRKPGRTGYSGPPDHVAPEISFRLLNSRRNHLGEYGPRLRVALSGKDEGSGVRGLYWRVSPDRKWKRYRRPVSAYGRARRRAGKLEFMSRDRAGNRSRVTAFSFRIDDVPPRMPFIYLGRPTGSTSMAPRKGILIPTIEPHARMFYRFNKGPFRGAVSGTRIAIPAEGNLRVTFRISDAVGNARVRTHVIRSDRTPPRTTIQTN